MNTNRKSRKTADAIDRLAALLKTKDFVPFHTDLPDKEYDYVKLSIYGATKTNELFVRITNGRVTFVETISSPLVAPSMADRIWGMDVSDSDAAFELANRMWEKHKTELIKR